MPLGKGYGAAIEDGVGGMPRAGERNRRITMKQTQQAIVALAVGIPVMVWG